MALLEIILRPAVFAPVLAISSYLIYHLFFAGPKRPNIPIVGAKEGDWFPYLQATWRNTLDFQRACQEADTRYRGRAVHLPIFGTPNLIHLPREEISFVNEAPDSQLSMHAMAIESLQTDYTSPDPYLVTNPVHHKLITTTLTNQIGNLVPDVADETQYAFDQLWGSSTGWKEVGVYDTLRRIIGSVTNRVFVGLPLCRNPDYLELGMAYAQDVPVASQLLRLLSPVIRPLAAYFITIPAKRHSKAFNQLIFPEIQARLDEYDARQQDPEKKSIKAKNDFLQWTVQQAKEMGDPYHWKLETLAGRIILLNFAAIHTSSFAITSALLEMAHADKADVNALRKEIEDVLAEHGGEWDKRALAQMTLLDSWMRESMRLNSFVTVGLMRLVMPKEGITTPSGVKIPKGCTVTVPSYAVLQDENVYDDAQEFKPFRFAELRKDESVGYIKRAQKAFATTSNDYLAFGHGRNACPGRFFAANELKLMLAHVVLHYDIEAVTDEKPGTKWYAMNRIPSFEATIRVRRRA
ncbi:cytochrome P450 [Podospora australis]|uniref:Cytochrome P450 n=1 Tax=Podospora australis TaxID=1536484 RepID=A0AAN6WM10_9PEZI|nr:cytochrome P450 [Podospora australis]